jgi:hypothetical protein
MSMMYPYQSRVTRLYHPEILPSPIVIEYTDLLYYSLASCLQASQTFLEQANGAESDHCLDIIQNLLCVDPQDDYTLLNELKAHGFHIAQPIDCVFVEAVPPVEMPEGGLE